MTAAVKSLKSVAVFDQTMNGVSETVAPILLPSRGIGGSTLIVSLDSRGIVSLSGGPSGMAAVQLGNAEIPSSNEELRRGVVLQKSKGVDQASVDTKSVENKDDAASAG